MEHTKINIDRFLKMDIPNIWLEFDEFIMIIDKDTVEISFDDQHTNTTSFISTKKLKKLINELDN